ncbi:MAG TPA: hypothetical protein DCP63_01145 [Bacteroidetes bacterium]|nr:hypothetical protein [Bacteroidota bacterium]
MNEQQFTDRAKKLTELRKHLDDLALIKRSRTTQFSVDVATGGPILPSCIGEYCSRYDLSDLVGKGAVQTIESIFREALKTRIESLTREIKELEDVSSMEAQGFKRAWPLTCGWFEGTPRVQTILQLNAKVENLFNDVEIWYREKPTGDRP